MNACNPINDLHLRSDISKFPSHCRVLLLPHPLSMKNFSLSWFKRLTSSTTISVSPEGDLITMQDTEVAT